MEQVKDGWFSTVERQIFALDPFAGKGADTGTTRMDRMVVLPEQPYQALAELNRVRQELRKIAEKFPGTTGANLAAEAERLQQQHQRREPGRG